MCRAVPAACPQCGGIYFRPFGGGTQRIEQEVERLSRWPRPVRMDVDTTSRKGAHARIIDAFPEGEYNVLIGTQMVAKGLHFPGVTLVGVVSADVGLNLPDYRAAERTFQILSQVAGQGGARRKGRRSGDPNLRRPTTMRSQAAAPTITMASTRRSSLIAAGRDTRRSPPWRGVCGRAKSRSK